LAITALQALGRGTPDNCGKRNRLLIKGMKAPFDFTEFILHARGYWMQKEQLCSQNGVWTKP
jgi:hypothetical protein